MFQVD